MKQIQQQNAQLLKMIAKIDKEGGRVSTRWDKIFVAGWYEHYTRPRVIALIQSALLCSSVVRQGCCKSNTAFVLGLRRSTQFWRIDYNGVSAQILVRGL